MRERDIEKYLVQQAKALQGEVRKVTFIGHRGAPDRLLMVPERKRVAWGSPGEIFKVLEIEYTYQEVFPAETVWIELKAPGKKPEPHQLREHERMRKMGQRVEVIDSLEGVDELMKEFE